MPGGATRRAVLLRRLRRSQVVVPRLAAAAALVLITAAASTAVVAAAPAQPVAAHEAGGPIGPDLPPGAPAPDVPPVPGDPAAVPPPEGALPTVDGTAPIDGAPADTGAPPDPGIPDYSGGYNPGDTGAVTDGGSYGDVSGAVPSGGSGGSAVTSPGGGASGTGGGVTTTPPTQPAPPTTTTPAAPPLTHADVCRRDLTPANVQRLFGVPNTRLETPTVVGNRTTCVVTDATATVVLTVAVSDPFTAQQRADALAPSTAGGLHRVYVVGQRMVEVDVPRGTAATVPAADEIARGQLTA